MSRARTIDAASKFAGAAAAYSIGGHMAKQQTPGEHLRARVMAEYEHHGTEPDARELETIDRAAAIADTISTLETVLKADGPTTTGPSGQIVLHPAIGELRMQRSALQRFLA